MKQLAGYLDGAIRCPRSSFLSDPRDFDIFLWGRRYRFVGLTLGDEVVVLDYKFSYTFRISLPNILHVPYRLHHMRCLDPPYDSACIATYLSENKDNPYGLWNVIQAVGSNPRPAELTQVPPLYYPKDANSQRQAVERMRDLAQPGDIFFTFHRQSGLSWLIRKWDRGMWSHAGMVGRDSLLHEMTTSGLMASGFSRLCGPSLDVGLYRIQLATTAEQRERVCQWLDKKATENLPYAWYKLIRIGLQLKLGIPYKRGPSEVTPGEMMRANCLKLICYA